MNRFLIFTIFISISTILGVYGCQIESVTETPTMTERPIEAPQTDSIQPQDTIEPPNEYEQIKDDNDMASITLTIGSEVFSIKLYDSDIVGAFLSQLPMTLSMSELNRNEKYYYLTENLPTDAQQVGSVNTGDLMLYGSDCLVLFYESFHTSYKYTKLGYVENASGLADALGQGSVQLTFAVVE